MGSHQQQTPSPPTMLGSFNSRHLIWHLMEKQHIKITTSVVRTGCPKLDTFSGSISCWDIQKVSYQHLNMVKIMPQFTFRELKTFYLIKFDYLSMFRSGKLNWGFYYALLTFQDIYKKYS